MNKESFVRLSVDFLAKICVNRRQQNDVFKALKQKMLTENSVSGKTVLQKCRKKKTYKGPTNI